MDVGVYWSPYADNLIISHSAHANGGDSGAPQKICNIKSWGSSAIKAERKIFPLHVFFLSEDAALRIDGNVPSVSPEFASDLLGISVLLRKEKENSGILPSAVWRVPFANTRRRRPHGNIANCAAEYGALPNTQQFGFGARPARSGAIWRQSTLWCILSQ